MKILWKILGEKINSYLLLALTLFGFSWLYHKYGDEVFFPGVITEIAGIFIAITFVDLFSEHRLERRNSKLNELALKDLSKQFNRLISIITGQFTSATKANNDKHFDSLEDFLTEETANEICLHLNTQGPAPISPSSNWENYLQQWGNEFIKDIDIITNKFIGNLSSETIELFENLKNSALITAFRSLPSMRSVPTLRERKNQLLGMQGFYQETFYLLLEIKNHLHANEMPMGFSGVFLRANHGARGNSRVDT